MNALAAEVEEYMAMVMAMEEGQAEEERSRQVCALAGLISCVSWRGREEFRARPLTSMPRCPRHMSIWTGC